MARRVLPFPGMFPNTPHDIGPHDAVSVGEMSAELIVFVIGLLFISWMAWRLRNVHE